MRDEGWTTEIYACVQGTGGDSLEMGSVEKSYREVFRCRASRKKQTLFSKEDTAYEQFVNQTIVMQTRKYPQIKYGCRVEYAGCTWEIKMLEPNGNELTITMRKVDV